MANPAPVTRSSQIIPPAMGARAAIRYIQATRTMQPLDWGRERDFRAIVAVLDDLVVKVWLNSKADPTHAPASDPSRYTVVTPDGPRVVVSAAVASDQNSIVLTLDSAPPEGTSTVEIQAGTIRGIGGALAALTILPFDSSSTPAPEPTDPPIVTDWSPAVGSTIQRDASISFSVLSESELATVVVWVRFDQLHRAALAFDGSVFRDLFAGSVEEIEGGRRYTVRRTSGWPSPPVIVVHATNCNGEETLHVH